MIILKRDLSLPLSARVTSKSSWHFLLLLRNCGPVIQLLYTITNNDKTHLKISNSHHSKILCDREKWSIAVVEVFEFLWLRLYSNSCYRLLSFAFIFDVNVILTSTVKQLTRLVDVKMIILDSSFITNPFDINSLPDRDHLLNHLLFFRVTGWRLSGWRDEGLIQTNNFDV